MAPGSALPDPRPAAVVDIGSNSIRLVVFRDRSRSQSVVFNERVICAIGRDMARTGRLHAEGVEMAHANLPRFAAIVRAMGIDDPVLLATAATREAEDGPDFLKKVEETFGHRVVQLDGNEEARLAALGVISGLPDASGVVADLGGGSLELVAVANGSMSNHISLPLGPLRLAATIGEDREDIAAHVDKQLGKLDWLAEAASDGTIYIVGGAWRALARLHMEQTGYPLRVIHNYRMGGRDAAEFCGVVAGLGVASLARIDAIPRARVPTLPAAATVLERLIDKSGAGQIVFSAFGIREGSQFDALDAGTRDTDPLIIACRQLADREARVSGSGDELFEWVSPLFPDENEADRRLRHAACLLADIGWHEHPDYRAEQVYFRILRLQLLALSHEARAQIALAVYRRYGGSSKADTLRVADALLDDGQFTWGRRLGAALRLAETLTGGNAALLDDARLVWDSGLLVLELENGHADLYGDVIRNRFGALARHFGVEGEIRGKGLQEPVRVR